MANADRLFANDLYHICREYHSSVCLFSSDSDISLTYSEVLNCLSFLAPMLSKPFPNSNKVLTILPNSFELLLLFLSSLYNGFDFIPVNPTASLPELTSLIERNSDSIVITADGQNPDIHNLLASRALSFHILNGDSLETWRRESFPLNPLPPRIIRSPNLLISTSGSTGTPKTISISADRLWSSAVHFSETYSLNSSAVFWNFLPMHYLGGLYNLCLIPLSVGASVAISPSFTGSTIFGFWQSVERLEITHIWLVPTILRAVNQLFSKSHQKTQSTKLQAAFIGTAHIDPAEKQMFSSTHCIPIYENYGLSETTFISMMTPHDTYTAQGSYYKGTLWDNISVKLGVSDPIKDTEGNFVYPVLVKSPYIMNGYILSDGSLDMPVTADGYYDTGDLGWLDGQHLYISSRKRQIIKRGGILVNLCEIEQLILSIITSPGCVAVPIQHDFYGESFIVCILSEELSTLSTQTSDINTDIYQALTRSKWPEKIYYMQEFPLTTSGKIDKPAIARYFGHHYSSAIL